MKNRKNFFARQKFFIDLWDKEKGNDFNTKVLSEKTILPCRRQRKLFYKNKLSIMIPY